VMTHHVPTGSGPSTTEVKPLLPTLVFILSTWWLTVLLELCCLEEEEEVIDPHNLRVHALIYRRGPGYSMSSGCPAAGFPIAVALAWVLLSSIPLLGCRSLYKVPFPLDRHIRGICPPACLGSFRGGGACLVRLVEEGLAFESLPQVTMQHQLDGQLAED
jgi:hypothetical protein